MIVCNVTVVITVKLHYCKQLLHKVKFFLAWEQALHLEESQEPHAKGDMSARGGERTKSLQQSLTNFPFHLGNCRKLRGVKTVTVSLFLSFLEETDLPHMTTYLPGYKHQHFDSVFIVWKLTNTTDMARLIIIMYQHTVYMKNNCIITNWLTIIFCI